MSVSAVARFTVLTVVLLAIASSAAILDAAPAPPETAIVPEAPPPPFCGPGAGVGSASVPPVGVAPREPFWVGVQIDDLEIGSDTPATPGVRLFPGGSAEVPGVDGCGEPVRIDGHACAPASVGPGIVPGSLPGPLDVPPAQGDLVTADPACPPQGFGRADPWVDARGDVMVGTLSIERGDLSVAGHAQIEGDLVVQGQSLVGVGPDTISLGDSLSRDGLRALALKAGDETRVTITKDGNVGIGTSMPETRLHVDGSAFMTGGVMASGGATFGVQRTTGPNFDFGIVEMRSHSARIPALTVSQAYCYVCPVLKVVDASHPDRAYLTLLADGGTIWSGVEKHYGCCEQTFLDIRPYSLHPSDSYAGQRFTIFRAPTLSPGSVATITGAATLAIEGPPTNGGGGRLADPSSLWVQAGTSRFDGRVGIGTATPTQALDVAGNAHVRGALVVGGQGVIMEHSETIHVGDLYGGDGYRALALRAGDDTRIMITLGGDVGIGTSSPSARLHVAGDVRADGHVLAHASAHVGDVAEPVSGAGLSPGDVVERAGFDALGKLVVRKATAPLSRGVVGVVSTSPSLMLAGLPSDTPLAVSGIVPVRVVGPVAADDLLVSSATPGAAMACPTGASCTGALVGKALEGHAGDGEGSVRAMIALG